MRCQLGTVLAVCAAMLAAGCGEEESQKAAVKEPALASAATLERDPRALSCGHVTDQLEWADETRRATVAIADGMSARGLNRLQKTQSLFYAMTELCKGRPASHRPADPAVEAVRSGRYRADLDSP
jgi:hypothetical protein